MTNPNVPSTLSVSNPTVDSTPVLNAPAENVTQVDQPAAGNAPAKPAAPSYDDVAVDTEVDQTLLDKRAADSSEAAKKQAEEDEKFHRENPDVPLVRAANPAVGGESF